LTSKKEHFYIQRIVELEKQVAELFKVNAELTEQVAKLTDKIASLLKNSSNSSKPPSSDIVKPANIKQSDGPRRQGGQPGHQGVNRQPFDAEQIDHTIPLYADSCDCGYADKYWAWVFVHPYSASFTLPNRVPLKFWKKYWARHTAARL